MRIQKLAPALLLFSILFSCTTPQAPGDAPAAPETAGSIAPVHDTPALPTQGTVYYVRPDGGSPEQCTGLADAPYPGSALPYPGSALPYPGSGAGQPCAWDHPFRALPPGGPALLAGGDTLVIGAGEYMMGYGAPGADACDSSYPWDCYMSPIPSGPDPAHPTRLLGAGWGSGCPARPSLWGTERAGRILNLADVGNIEIGCLEITDHSQCVESHADPNLACERDTPPFGDWAAVGLYAEDSANVHLFDLNIHGLAGGGVHAGRLADWTVERVRIAGNGWVGWDGDIEGDDSNAGTMIFRHWTVEWNGCGETYPGGQPTGCWAQSAGGYGDGVGTGTTGGHWVIEDSIFQNNTSDGLDLLYARLITSSIEIRRTIARDNAGNQVKTSGPTLVENSLLSGHCGFFDGQPFTYNVDPCRAGGDALVVDMRPGDRSTVVNSTLTGEGTCLVIASCALSQTCSGGEVLGLRNSIFQGQLSYFDPQDTTCFAWYDDESGNPMPASPFQADYSIANGAKFGNVDPCAGDHVQCDVDPGLTDPALATLDGHLLPGSPAIDAGLAGIAPFTDLEGRARDASPDLGAYEWGEGGPMAYLPYASKKMSDDGTPIPQPTSTPIVTPTPGPALVDDFIYQLQNIDLVAIGVTAYDLAIVDYSADGSDDLAFTAAEIGALKHSPGGEKVVLAYMSIGEAENYRFYWDPSWDADGDGRPDPGAPTWLDIENPDWEGNYKVHYWDPGWQAIVFQYTDRLLQAGFDGAYLDIVDAYEYYADQGRSTAAQEMVDFVAAIRAYARAADPDFLIFPQNGAALAADLPGYLDDVDGIGQEDIYYGYDGDDLPTPPTVTAELEGYLDLFRDAGKLVLTADYATTPAHVDDAYARSQAKGYVPFCTVRDLDQLIINAGHEPD